MTIEVRAAVTDEDLELVVGIVNTPSPSEPTSVADMQWADATYPGGVRLPRGRRPRVRGPAR